MATPSPAQPDEEVRGKHRRAEQQAALIAAFVIDALGEPPEFRRVTVVKVWGNRFRVNVQTGDATSARVAHSFFVTAEETGQVTDSAPPITRLY